MNPKSIALGLLLLSTAVGWAAAHAGETTIQRAALPAAVSSALTARYPHAKVLRLIREEDKGNVVYEAEMTESGVRVDALIEPDGRLREEERAIPAAEIPAAVRAAHARSSYAKWRIDGRERLTTGDASAAPHYELLVTLGKKRVALVYARDGKLVKTTPLSASPRPPVKKQKATS